MRLCRKFIIFSIANELHCFRISGGIIFNLFLSLKETYFLFITCELIELMYYSIIATLYNTISVTNCICIMRMNIIPHLFQLHYIYYNITFINISIIL